MEIKANSIKSMMGALVSIALCLIHLTNHNCSIIALIRPGTISFCA